MADQRPTLKLRGPQASRYIVHAGQGSGGGAASAPETPSAPFGCWGWRSHSFGSLGQRSVDRPSPDATGLRPREPLEVLRVVVHQSLDRPTCIPTKVHTIRIARRMVASHRARGFRRRCRSPAPRRCGGQGTTQRPALRRDFQLVGRAAVSSPKDGPRFDDRLHPFGISTDIGVVAAGHRAKRRANLRPISAGGDV